MLQILASIQQRTSPLKFDHLAEKSEQGSISNLSTKAATAEAEKASLGEVASFPGPCASSGGRLPEALDGFSIGFQRPEVSKSCRSRQELSNEYLLFTCKIRLRYSSFRTPPVPSVFEDSPVYQPASQPRTSLSKFAKN